MNTHSLKEGEKIAKEGILHLIILGILKTIAGVLTGMTVLLADAFSTFADTLGLFASYFGLNLSRKSSDAKFEYGYYKIETFAALVISLGIIYLGYVIVIKSIDIFLSPPEVGQHFPFAITTTVISIVLSSRLAKSLQEAGEKVNSLSLIANAKDKKMDMFAGIAILGSIIANYKGIPYVEGAISLVIAVIILKEGVASSKESLFFLLDYWNDPSLTKEIRKVFKKEKDLVLKVNKLRLRRAGTFIFGEAFVEINPFAGLQDLREELNILQKKIKALNPHIKDFAIYNNISKAKKIKIAIPIKSGSGLKAKVAVSPAQTVAYVFVEIRKNKIKEAHTKKLKNSEKKPVEFVNYLKKEKVQVLIDNDLNSLTYYNLRRTNHILIYPNFSDIKNVEDTLQLFLLDT